MSFCVVCGLLVWQIKGTLRVWRLKYQSELVLRNVHERGVKKYLHLIANFYFYQDIFGKITLQTIIHNLIMTNTISYVRWMALDEQMMVCWMYYREWWWIDVYKWGDLQILVGWLDGSWLVGWMIDDEWILVCWLVGWMDKRMDVG